MLVPLAAPICKTIRKIVQGAHFACFAYSAEFQHVNNMKYMQIMQNYMHKYAIKYETKYENAENVGLSPRVSAAGTPGDKFCQYVEYHEYAEYIVLFIVRSVCKQLFS